MDWPQRPQRTLPLNDLSRCEDRDELSAAIARVLDSGWFLLGPEGAAFEAELAGYVGADQAVALASGTDALELAMRAFLPRGGSAVLTAANAGGYASVAARRASLGVSWADVDESTHCLTADTVRAALTPEIGLVVVTHLYGRPAAVDEIVALCHPLGVAVVEDCAQAIGAFTASGPVGSRADAATFSFYPTKNLGALGDGGALTTSDPGVADRVRKLRQYGWLGKYDIAESGGANSRLDELQAAVLRSRLPKVAGWNRRRREILASYREAAGGRVEVLPVQAGHAAHLAVCVTTERNELRRHLRALGIATDVHYPIPDHRQAGLGAGAVKLPVTEILSERVLSVPLFPQLSDEEVERVAAALASF